MMKKVSVLTTVCVTLGILFVTSHRALAQDVDIYPDSTAQVIRGFGGAFIEFWQPDLTADHVETAFGLGEGQLGLSILRLGINPNSNQWGENLEAAQKAAEMGAIIFASPWNAPSDLLKAKISPGDPDTVDVEKYDQYAAHLADFNNYMKSNGVNLYAVSVQNEPDFADQWTGWSSENMVAFLRDYAPAIGTRVMAPESFQFRKPYTDPILLDSLAAAHTDIIGGHIYGGGNSAYPLAEEMGKDLWMTEYLLNLNTGNISKPWNDFTDEERWAETMEMLRSVHGAMKSNMNAYVWWYLKRYYSFIGDGEFGETLGQPTKRGYAFAQFAKFVRPGFVRLHNNGPFGRGYIRIYNTAYVDTTARKLVIVAINDEPSDKELNFNIPGLGSTAFARYVTSVDQDMERLDDVEAAESVLTVTLPTKTVTTFVAEGVSVASEGAPEIPSGYTLEQNYPNPFGRATTIAYVLPTLSDVSLKLYDVHGREVKTLVDGPQDAGTHRVRFDASGLASGIYFYTLRAGNAAISKGMLVTR